MRRYVLKKGSLIFVLMTLLLLGCSPRLPEEVNVQATVDFVVRQTNDAIQIETPTAVPTSTTQPTNTPAPSATHALSDAEEGLIYIQEIMPYMEDISDGLDDFSGMTTRMATDVALMFDDSFKSDLYFLLDQIYEDLSEMVEITPPASMVTMHDYLKEALFEFALTRSYFKSGLDEINVDDIESANTHMNLFSDYIVLATGEITP